MANAIMNNEPGSRSAGWMLLIGLALVALVGFIISAKLAAGYHPSKPVSMLENKFFCGKQEITGYGCSGVFASRYGKFLDIPLPMFGMAYFAAVMIWIAVFGRKTLNPFFGLFLLSGAMVSLLLLFILLVVLPGQCRWCLMIHLCNGLIILGAFTGFGTYGGLLDFREWRVDMLKAVLVGLIIVSVAGWTAAFILNLQKDTLQKAYLQVKLDPNIQLWQFKTQKPRDVSFRPDDHILGNPSAPVKIVAYKDYQCPHCREASILLEDLYRKYPDRVALAFRHWPLSNQCNPNWPADQYPFACPAARAAEAVALLKGPNAFWEYNKKLVEYSLRLDESPYVKLAGQLGISSQDFLTAVENPKVTQKIRTDIASMKKLGIGSVPAVFLNGRYIEGWQAKNLLDKLVKSESQIKTTTQNTK